MSVCVRVGFLAADGIAVYFGLLLGAGGQRAAWGSLLGQAVVRRRHADARGLCGVAPHRDVVPTTLRDRDIWQPSDRRSYVELKRYAYVCAQSRGQCVEPKALKTHEG